MLLERSQSYDFIRLEGLQKLTNVTAHDWDLYILKELVDNALDADEADGRAPHIHVVMSYMEEKMADRKERAVSIEVSNSARFPLERVKDLFALDKRVSNKDYYNIPSRGAQGNALKTILGIPYALRNHYFFDYNLDRVPLAISYGDKRVVVKLDVNEIDQHVGLQTETYTEDEPENRTKISVNIQRFFQQRPRTIDELIHMAQAFALFNPHASFTFEFIFTQAGNKPVYETREYAGDANWRDKYDHQRRSPIQWYKLNQFRELVFALSRNASRPDYTLVEVIAEFGIHTCPSSPEFSDTMHITLIHQYGDKLKRLYELLKAHYPLHEPIYLGKIGKKFLLEKSDVTISDKDGQPLFLYRYFTNENIDDKNPPFTLEVALYANTQGKRHVNVGINHTPTYADPFFNKPLMPPNADEPTKSLEKLLDYYDLREETLISLVLHLISPNMVYENYGKSAISDEPYRDILTAMVDELVTEYREATRPPDPIDYLTEPARGLLPDIIRHFEGSVFTEVQILYELKRRMGRIVDDDIRADLQTPNADSRLQAVIREKPIGGLHKRQSGRLAVPRHPKDTINISFATMSMTDVVSQFQIRAMIITNSPNIEELLIAVGYPLLYDVGILRADGNLPSAIDLLIGKYKNVLTNNAPEDDILLPQIWIVRDATVEAIQQTRVELQDTLARYEIEFDPIYDLGLHPDDATRYSWVEQKPATPVDRSLLKGRDEIRFYADAMNNARLESISPKDLRIWFDAQLEAHNLPMKYLPIRMRLTSYATDRLRQRFESVIANIAFKQYRLDVIEERLIDLWRTTETDWESKLYQQLEETLKANERESWLDVFDEAIKKLMDTFLKDNEQRVIEWMNNNA